MARRKPRNAREVKSEIFDYDDDPETTPKRGLGWLLFRAPGALLLWWQYSGCRTSMGQRPPTRQRRNGGFRLVDVLAWGGGAGIGASHRLKRLLFFSGLTPQSANVCTIPRMSGSWCRLRLCVHKKKTAALQTPPFSPK